MRTPQFTWNPANIPLVEDNVRWNAYQRWDLRFNKQLFGSRGLSAAFYIDVINLFANHNMTRFDVAQDIDEFQDSES